MSALPVIPHSAQAERAILGAIILGNQEWPALTLEPDDFFLPYHKAIFRHFQQLHAESKPVDDLVVLWEELKNEKAIADCGGVGYLSGLTDGLQKVNNLPHHVDILKKKARLRKSLYLSTKIAEICAEGGDDSEILQRVDALSTTFPKTAKVVSKQLTCTPASEITPRQLRWFWPERIPLGKLTLLVGDPDVGKSLTIADIIARCTTGRPWPDCENDMPPCSVAVLAAEDDWEDTLVPRFIAAGADLSKVFRVDPIQVEFKGKTIKRSAALDTDIEAFEELLRERPEIKLISFDPLASYIGDKNRNVEREIRAVLDSVKELAERTGVTIISADHFNKTALASALHRVSGSTSVVGAPRAVWGFQKDPDDPKQRLMSRIKLNVSANHSGLRYSIVVKSVNISGCEFKVPHVAWGGATDTTADEIFSRSADPEEAKIGKAVRWLKEFLASGAKLAADVYTAGEEQGYDAQFLKRSVRARAGADKPYQEGRRWFWKLKELPA
jgi:putative DNA primase/helicase